MRKTIVLVISLMFVSLFLLVGCKSQGSNAEGSNVTLDFMTNSGDLVLKAYENVAKKYEEENEGVTVTVTGQGKDFESLMKAKMATNDLPDLWMTHGWSVARYSEYLEPLTDQPWADQIIEPLLPIISNDDGDIFVLPLDVDKSGVLINEDVLKEANVDIDKLLTWDDFLQAFESIKGTGKVPVGIGGKDPRNIAQFLDVMSSQMYITSPSNNHADQLVEGTFDWSNWADISQVLLDLHEKGYLNKDVLTASGDSVNKQMAQNEVGFMFATNSAVQTMLDFNPDANIGFMPLPSFHSDTNPILIGGERNAVGVWKDSEDKKEAIKFLEFLSKEENMTSIAKAQGQMPAFKDISVDLGKLTPSYEKYSDVEIQPYFDRVYLPSGMWSTLQTVGSGLISGDLSVENAVELMEQDYNRLREEKQE